MTKKKVTEPDGTVEEVDMTPEEQADVEAEKGKHIYVESSDGTPVLQDAPEGYDGDAPARRITLNGVNFEHTATHANGIWIYRSM